MGPLGDQALGIGSCTGMQPLTRAQLSELPVTKRLPSALNAAHRIWLGGRGAMAAATAAAVDPAE